MQRTEEMLTVAVSGSPRRDGNTSILLKEVLDNLEGEKELISLAGLNLHPCTNCGGCFTNPRCIVEDDIPPIIDRMTKADIIILGSPCYFKGVTSQLKMLIDRTVSVYETHPFRNKIGAGVVVQDEYGKGRGGESVVRAIAEYIGTMGMLYVGGIIGEGGLDLYNVKKDKRAMSEAQDLANRIQEIYALTHS